MTMVTLETIDAINRGDRTPVANSGRGKDDPPGQIMDAEIEADVDMKYHTRSPTRQSHKERFVAESRESDSGNPCESTRICPEEPRLGREGSMSAAMGTAGASSEGGVEPCDSIRMYANELEPSKSISKSTSKSTIKSDEVAVTLAKEQNAESSESGSLDRREEGPAMAVGAASIEKEQEQEQETPPCASEVHPASSAPQLQQSSADDAPAQETVAEEFSELPSERQVSLPRVTLITITGNDECKLQFDPSKDDGDDDCRVKLQRSKSIDNSILSHESIEIVSETVVEGQEETVEPVDECETPQTEEESSEATAANEKNEAVAEDLAGVKLQVPDAETEQQEAKNEPACAEMVETTMSNGGNEASRKKRFGLKKLALPKKPTSPRSLSRNRPARPRPASPRSSRPPLPSIRKFGKPSLSKPSLGKKMSRKSPTNTEQAAGQNAGLPSSPTHVKVTKEELLSLAKSSSSTSKQDQDWEAKEAKAEGCDEARDERFEDKETKEEKVPEEEPREENAVVDAKVEDKDIIRPNISADKVDVVPPAPAPASLPQAVVAVLSAPDVQDNQSCSPSFMQQQTLTLSAKEADCMEHDDNSQAEIQVKPQVSEAVINYGPTAAEEEAPDTLTQEEKQTASITAIAPTAAETESTPLTAGTATTTTKETAADATATDVTSTDATVTFKVTPAATAATATGTIETKKIGGDKSEPSVVEIFCAKTEECFWNFTSCGQSFRSRNPEKMTDTDFQSRILGGERTRSGKAFTMVAEVERTSTDERSDTIPEVNAETRTTNALESADHQERTGPENVLTPLSILTERAVSFVDSIRESTSHSVAAIAENISKGVDELNEGATEKTEPSPVHHEDETNANATISKESSSKYRSTPVEVPRNEKSERLDKAAEMAKKAMNEAKKRGDETPNNNYKGEGETSKKPKGKLFWRNKQEPQESRILNIFSAKGGSEPITDDDKSTITRTTPSLSSLLKNTKTKLAATTSRPRTPTSKSMGKTTASHFRRFKKPAVKRSGSGKASGMGGLLSPINRKDKDEVDAEESEEEELVEEEDCLSANLLSHDSQSLNEPAEEPLHHVAKISMEVLGAGAEGMSSGSVPKPEETASAEEGKG